MIDAVVLGGGPAGLAAATALARSGRSTVVFERAGYDAARAGETFGGEVRPLLEELGVPFAALPRVPFRGVRSAWGAGALSERSSILKPLGEGFHVERARFDALLASCAARAGAVIHEGSGVATIERTEGGFVVEAPGLAAVSARLLVDASGRGASASAAVIRERRWLSFDRLVAIIALFSPRQAPEPELLLEAAEEGWWYAVPQPGGALLVAFLTDSDLAVAAGPRAGLEARFRAALARTIYIAPLAEGAAPLAPLKLARADSGVLVPGHGEDWLAVGDAAFACDPLGGDGVVRALRSGLSLAAPGLPAFEAYLDKRAGHYSAEARFEAAPFWTRRRARSPDQAALSLQPLQALRSTGARACAAAEALLPRAAISAVLDRPGLAHEALSALRAAAPLSDRRLLVGLQTLIAEGALALA